MTTNKGTKTVEYREDDDALAGQRLDFKLVAVCLEQSDVVNKIMILDKTENYVFPIANVRFILSEKQKTIFMLCTTDKGGLYVFSALSCNLPFYYNVSEWHFKGKHGCLAKDCRFEIDGKTYSLKFDPQIVETKGK